jgi:hypothetical protein
MALKSSIPLAGHQKPYQVRAFWRRYYIRDNFKKGFSDIFEGKVIWYVVDLQTEGSVSRAVEVLENISSHIFSIENPDDRKDLTFIVIDEAHNIVPRTLLPEDGNTRGKTQAIINRGHPD